MSRIDLYKGDCLAVMDELIAKGVVVDAIITDPPYGTTACKWDSVINFDEMWIRLNKLIKPNGIIALCGSQPFSSTLICSNIDNFRHEWIWIKNTGSNFANTVREPMKEHESVIVFSKGKWTYNKQMQERIGNRKGKVTKSSFKSKSDNYQKFEERDNVEIPILRVPSSHQKFKVERGLHPTQKPIALMEYLIRTYTNENELVLDFTMGSGTTGVACKNLGRDFIGIEMDDKYFDIAKNRIEDTVIEKGLFDE